MSFLKHPVARLLAVLLLVQAFAYYAVASRDEIVPLVSPLSTFPPTSGDWTVTRDIPLDQDIQDVLRADDTLNRIYSNRAGAEASLFIAFFKTQRYGQSPHSPKNCLPGAGWQRVEDSPLSVAVPDRDTPIVINKYVVARGDQQSLVLYWYQSHNRVIARELTAKMWLVADALRYHRSDTALVRVIVPVREGMVDEALRTAVGFVHAAYPDIVRALPR